MWVPKNEWGKLLLLIKGKNQGHHHYECYALINWATGPLIDTSNYIIFFKLSIDDNWEMVGRVGYAPTTPAMSMQYSTIELTAQLAF